MLDNFKHFKQDDYCIDTACRILDTEGTVCNPDFVEIMCQGISSTVDFAKKLKEDNIESIQNLTFLDWEVHDFEKYHPIFKHGRLAQELVNNLKLMKKGLENLNNFEKQHIEVRKLIEDYYV